MCVPLGAGNIWFAARAFQSPDCVIATLEFRPMTGGVQDAEAVHIFQVVPKLPPVISGVTDYATELAGALRENFGIGCSLVAGLDDQGTAEKASLEKSLHQRLQESITDVRASKKAILIHYSGYGYDQKGAPWWLLRSLASLCATSSNSQIFTVFHELYAVVPPWRRAFWYSHSQKSVAKGMLSLSRGSLCTIARHEDILRRWNPSAAISRKAIPSGVGEPSSLPLVSARKGKMVIFGSKAIRDRTYSLGDKAIKAAIDNLDIDEIFDVGAMEAAIPRSYSPRITRCGALPKEELSRLLLECKAGCLSYYPGYLAKSSVFASLCAHGVLPVCSGSAESERDGLYDDIQYWLPGKVRLEASQADCIARQAHNWYEGHKVEQHAQWISLSMKRQ